MIKIEPFFATDYPQVRALLRHQPEPLPADHECTASSLFVRGLTFWQHWLPCQLHLSPSIYVAKEDGIVLALIALHSTGRSRSCWQIDRLIVHPHHRGRGIAQELLRYAFALFGSQGVSHFVSEVSDQNSAALSLFGSCGFRRCAKVTYYEMEVHPDDTPAAVPESGFRFAGCSDKKRLFQLHQECLPPDIRTVFSLHPDDFIVSDIPLKDLERIRNRLGKRRLWYWTGEDKERRVITCAVRVSCHRQGDYHLDFAIHPGWSHLTGDLVAFTLNSLRCDGAEALISARVFDFQPGLAEALQGNGMERVGSFSLLAREHWVRAKQPKLKLEKAVALNPAINMPLATERRSLN